MRSLNERISQPIRIPKIAASKARSIWGATKTSESARRMPTNTYTQSCRSRLINLPVQPRIWIIPPWLPIATNEILPHLPWPMRRLMTSVSQSISIPILIVKWRRLTWLLIRLPICSWKAWTCLQANIKTIRISLSESFTELRWTVLLSYLPLCTSKHYQRRGKTMSWAI